MSVRTLSHAGKDKDRQTRARLTRMGEDNETDRAGGVEMAGDRAGDVERDGDGAGDMDRDMDGGEWGQWGGQD